MKVKVKIKNSPFHQLFRDSLQRCRYFYEEEMWTRLLLEIGILKGIHQCLELYSCVISEEDEFEFQHFASWPDYLSDLPGFDEE